MASFQSRLSVLALLVAVVSGSLCGLDQCLPASSAYNNSCCCSPGACLEDRYDTVTAIDNGVWTINTRNDPSQVGSSPAQNRAIIFRVTNLQRGAFLVLVNGVGLCDSSARELHSLEEAEGPLLHVIAPGDWHHVYLADYNEHFPQATVHVPPGRIPGLDTDTYQYELMDVEKPLAFLWPQLQIYPMKGLGQPFQLSTVRYEFFFFHPSTRTLVAGDIFFHFSCEPPAYLAALFPGLAKGTITFWDAMGSSMFKDKAEGVKSANLMLSLDFDRFLSIHGELGSQVPANAIPPAKHLVREALTTGQGPLSSWAEAQEVVA